MAKSKKNGFITFTLSLLGIFVILILTYKYVAKPYEYTGPAMNPTFTTGDINLTFTYYPSLYKLKRGDIIIYKRSGYEIDYISRVIGLPGENVSIIDNTIYINDESLTEPYAVGKTEPDGFELQLDSNSVFILGDNREESDDSRKYGPVPLTNIKAVYFQKL